MKEGDYGVALDDGPTFPIRIERKSLSDLYSCIGLHRDRFEHELERLTQYDYRVLIIEASLGEIANGYRRSRSSPRAALGALCAWRCGTVSMACRS